LQIPPNLVWRELRALGISLRRRRSWCISTDPGFDAKSADIIGLYLVMPANAVVLSIDEKPCIQALEREQKVWFSTLNRAALKSASFRSVKDLVQAI
jgi:hypothetical protein